MILVYCRSNSIDWTDLGLDLTWSSTISLRKWQQTIRMMDIGLIPGGLKPQGQSGGSLLVLALYFCGVHGKAAGSRRAIEVQVQVGLREVE